MASSQKFFKSEILLDTGHRSKPIFIPVCSCINAEKDLQKNAI